MTRIVSGRARGRRLAVPPGDVRPTTSRTREAVFSSLEHRIGDWPAVAVLDLFAGSGAMGLEAASRGAGSVLLVERDPRVHRVLRRNADLVGAEGVGVCRADAYRLGPRGSRCGPAAPADLVILDPPYRDEASAVAGLLIDLDRWGWLAPDALAVVERSSHDATFAWPGGWVSLADRRYADTNVSFGMLVASAPSPAEPDRP
ncbi:MAG: 16S rRNA (guanine(966)-N(2))-methyltransferase RsmD [Actinobacteria bacterium]|nr:16S rRNA (guanine(966)-N(2))-methyltransferase RsmD [Actinomycetota bacterium]